MNALSASGTGMLGPVARNAVISLTSSLASPETVSNSSEPLISDMSAVIGFSAKRSARTAQPPPDPPSWISQLQRPVALPPWRLVERVTAGPLEPPLEYELRDLEPSSSARVTAELEDGRFTIATDQPHVKVAWRISRRKEEK